jgi:ATP-dependent RNA helicase DeaD
MIENFEESGLRLEILNAIRAMGFETPTPVQQRVIPAILYGDSDIIALAQTGTGKTAAFGLPLLERLDPQLRAVQAIVLCPTRELCLQITGDLKKFSANLTGMDITAVYGGADAFPQIRALKAGSPFVVGTPGRVLDLIRRKALHLDQVRHLVLDEADEMLNMGFKEDLDQILSMIPGNRHTYLFSATMPREIAEIAENYMTDPDEIALGKRNEGAENVSHEYYVVHARDRYKALKRIADLHPHIYGIVFCRTRQETKEVADHLIGDGYNASALHGDLSQAQREHVMGQFRRRHLRMLVATDVAARGLDVSDLSHVINYNLPDDPEIYIHRSGRTGRAGKTGVSISIVHTRETDKIRVIEKTSGKKFERKMVPGGKEICEKQLFNLIDKMENVQVDNQEIDNFLPVIFKKLEWLSREELIKRFVSVEFNRFLEYYRDAPDLNSGIQSKDKSKREPASRPQASARYARLYINAGLKQGLTAGRLIALINVRARDRRIGIGKIDIQRKFSFFEVEEAHAPELIALLNGELLEGLSLVVKESDEGRRAGNEALTSGRRTPRTGPGRVRYKKERREARSY